VTIEELAELLAIHLWAVLVAVATVSLLLAWLLWHCLQRYGPAVTGWLRNVIHLARPHARRLPLPDTVLGIWGMMRRLGGQALVSIAVAVTASIAFIEIADEIAADDDLGRFDAALSDALSRHASDAQLRIFAILTDLGDKRFLMAIAVAVALALMIRKRWFVAAAWVLATAGGGLLNLALKALFERSRPERWHAFASADGWSFPSGHSSGSFIVYGLLGYLVMLYLPRRSHLPMAALLMLLIVCVGFSRVVLQVHYFSDVLGGYAFAASWVAAWIAGLEAFRRRRQNALPG
jgi:membrane-associated phospholipid phosphatase